MLEALLVVVACFARSLPNEGARRSSEKQAITPARYDEGTIATNFNATTTGVRDTITAVSVSSVGSANRMRGSYPRIIRQQLAGYLFRAGHDLTRPVIFLSFKKLAPTRPDPTREI